MVVGMEVVIGIDPGATSGWAGVTVEHNPALLLFDSLAMPKPGTAKDVPANTPTFIAKSLVESLRRLGHTVVAVAIEDQYLSRNPDSMKKLSRNAGRWEEAWRWLGIPVEWVNAQVWQSAELGTSRIDSDEVKRRCAMKVLGLWRRKVGAHASDAALIARYLAIRLAYRAMRRAK
jgi:Holliday junction resolvasome RuvABC endonuclease subunit